MKKVNLHFSFKRKLLITLGVLILSYLCLEAVSVVTIGPPATQLFINFLEIQRSKNAFSTAKALWEAKGNSNYQITVHNLNFKVDNLYACSQIKDILTVKDKKVVDTSALPLEICRPVYDQLTIEAMLGRVEQDLTTVNPFTTEMQVNFNPEFGFVSYYSIRKYAPFSLNIYSGEPTVLTFSDFTLIDK